MINIIKNKIGWVVKFLFITLLSIKTFAQVQQEWVQRYNGPGNGDDKAYAIAVDISGNIYVTGESVGSGTGPDITTIKYNSSGVQQWASRYNGPGDTTDIARAIIVDNQGNVYVTGQSTGVGTGFDYVTIKYDAQGTEQWVNRYNGPGNRFDAAVSIALDNSGNVIVTGLSTGSNLAYGYATIKYNPLGIQQWIVIYNSPAIYDDEACSVKTDNLGNVYVTGTSYAIGSFNDYATVKYNSSGVEQWVTRFNGFGGHSQDRAQAMVVDGDGNVYVTGSSTIGVTGYCYATVKYNSSGTELWESRYTGPGGSSASPYSIAMDNSGNVCVTGITIGLNNTIVYATVKYSSSGVMQWAATINGSAIFNGFFPSIAADSFGNFYVQGRSSDSIYKYNTIKYNSQGAQQWVEVYNGPANSFDSPSALAVDNIGNVIVTGYSTGIGSGTDYTTIKYSQITGIKPGTSGIPNEYSLSQNFPNPFNPSTKIGYQLAKDSYVHLRVYDLTGSRVKELVNKQQNAGNYSVEFDASNIPSGVYFYKLETAQFTSTKRMILVK